MDLKTLEFPAVLSHIERRAKTALGAEKIRTLHPLDAPASAHVSMQEIASAKAYILAAKAPTFGDFFDIHPQLKDIKIARVLSVQDLLRLRRFLAQLSSVLKRLQSPPETLEANALEPYMASLEPLDALKKELEALVDDEGLKENASNELKTQKNALRVLENRLSQKLKSVVDRHASMLSESFFTERQGRYVVPVKQTYKNRFKGSVVDYSASGETIYMEPEIVGEISADKRRVEAAIDTEIERILTTISQSLHAHYEGLRANHASLGALDAIFAKADYAVEMNMEPVAFADTLHLEAARHPLIDPKSVVPNDIILHPDTHLVIISGSNTGGKTVVLKTVGLLSMMAQSGLLIPVKPGSHLPFYSGIFADIGDEQSIEQSLSTFSSHLTNIQRIIHQQTSRSLIVLDEVGGGTDPKAGSAFARALLDHLSRTNHDIFVTTHYPELKAYAYEHPHAINASVAFDKDSLNPTYHLYLDTPGESHALLIAERLGMPEPILASAHHYFNNEQSPVSDLIQTLEQKKAQLERERDTLHAAQREVDALKSSLEAKTADLNAQKEALTDQYNRRFRREKEALESAFNQALEDLKKSAQLKPHEINAAKEALFNADTDAPTAQKDPHDYQPGDYVHVTKFNRTGQLKKALKKGQWQVMMGNVASTLKESEFHYIDPPKKIHQPAPPKAKTPKKRVASELDLRGLRVEEAASLLDKYLDDCALAKQPFARIIHGFGTFAIRDMVQKTLAQSSLIKSYRAGQGGEGGAGVTVVYFE